MSRYAIIVLGAPWYESPFHDIEGYKVSRKLEMLDKNPEEVALVVFSGGEDVGPFFYGGQDPRNICYTNYRRDYFEQRVFNHCRKHFIKMTGICRGFQFLNVMSGGKMYQHVNYHGQEHPAYFLWKKEDYVVSSTHHQLVKLPQDGIPIIWSTSRRSNVYIGPNGEIAVPPEKEIEAAIFPSTKTVGVQYHPEMMMSDKPGYNAYIELITDYIGLNFENFLNKYSEVSHAQRARQAGEA
jgi:gamma-glutamyl-gamma-aminobutyrate hydrolase PuuD